MFGCHDNGCLQLDRLLQVDQVLHQHQQLPSGNIRSCDHIVHDTYWCSRRSIITRLSQRTLEWWSHTNGHVMVSQYVPVVQVDLLVQDYHELQEIPLSITLLTSIWSITYSWSFGTRFTIWSRRSLEYKSLYDQYQSLISKCNQDMWSLVSMINMWRNSLVNLVDLFLQQHPLVQECPKE